MAAVIDGRHTYRPEAIGRVFGWFFLATFVFSIPAFFVGYSKMLETPSLITGNGVDPSSGISWAAASEVLLIVFNVGTAVIAYPVLKRESEMGAIGYVAARLCEAMFIAIGVISALAFLLMRQEGTATSFPVIGMLSRPCVSLTVCRSSPCPDRSGRTPSCGTPTRPQDPPTRASAS